MNECAAYQVFVGWHYSDTKMYFTLWCWTTKEILVLSAHQLIIFFQPFQSSIVIDSILSEAVKRYQILVHCITRQLSPLQDINVYQRQLSSLQHFG